MFATGDRLGSRRFNASVKAGKSRKVASYAEAEIAVRAAIDPAE